MRLKLEIKLKVRELTEDHPFSEIQEIYSKCGWGEGEKINLAIKGSYCYAMAYANSKVVGFSRVISDGISYALFVDTMVLPELKRRGIGHKLIHELVEYCKNRNIFMIKLISSEEARPFYKNYGFKECSSDAPGMILMLNNN